MTRILGRLPNDSYHGLLQGTRFRYPRDHRIPTPILAPRTERFNPVDPLPLATPPSKTGQRNLNQIPLHDTLALCRGKEKSISTKLEYDRRTLGPRLEE